MMGGKSIGDLAFTQRLLGRNLAKYLHLVKKQ